MYSNDREKVGVWKKGGTNDEKEKSISDGRENTDEV